MKYELKSIEELATLAEGSSVSVKGIARGLDQVGVYHFFFLEQSVEHNAIETQVVFARMLNEQYGGYHLVKPILTASSEGNIPITVDAKILTPGKNWLELEIETIYLNNYSITAVSCGIRRN